MTGRDVTAASRIPARSLHPGRAEAEALVLEDPLSFWGGVDAQGTLVDPHHPQRGQSLTGRVVVLPAGRGSSSSAAVLAELLRSGRGPAALVLGECDAILVVGALVAAEMYGEPMPIVQLPREELAQLHAGRTTTVLAGPAGDTAEVDQPQPASPDLPRMET